LSLGPPSHASRRTRVSRRGAVYRRFRNKDVLLENGDSSHIGRSKTKLLPLSLTVESAAKIPFPTLAEQIINSLVVSYRVNASLLRAVRQFLAGERGRRFLEESLEAGKCGRLNI